MPRAGRLEKKFLHLGATVLHVYVCVDEMPPLATKWRPRQKQLKHRWGILLLTVLHCCIIHAAKFVARSCFSFSSSSSTLVC